MSVYHITLPTTEDVISKLEVGDQLVLDGKIFCGRDAVLPKIVSLYEKGELAANDLVLDGSLIFHTAVSKAGVGPTSSNKFEIESSIPRLSEAGVKIHLGKGMIGADTIASLKENNSVYAVIPPVTALLESLTLSRKLVAFPELGMEAFYELEIKGYPAIVASAKGESIYGK